MARVMKGLTLAQPDAIGVMSRILVLTDSIIPLGRPCSIDALRLTVRACSATNARILQRCVHLIYRSSTSRA
jgi:hypothetical protein